MAITLVTFIEEGALEIFFERGLGVLAPAFNSCFVSMLANKKLNSLFEGLLLGSGRCSIGGPLLVSLNFEELLCGPCTARSGGCAPGGVPGLKGKT